MRLACTLVLVAGCSPESEPPSYSLDCIRTLDRAPSLASNSFELVLTSTCTDDDPRVSYVVWDHELRSIRGSGDRGPRYRATRIANLDGVNNGDELIGLVDSAPSYVAWFGQRQIATMHVDYVQDFDDLTVADLDRDGKPEVIVAGGDSLRASSVPVYAPTAQVASTDERVLVAGKAFRNAAVTAKNEIYYLAQPQGSTTVEIGVARASTSDPFAFVVTTLASDAAGTRGLIVADVDGDRIADAVGMAARVFVFTSRTGTVQFLDEAALAISTGDIDGNGVDEPVFIAADGASVRSIRVAADGSLTAEHLLDVHAQAMTIGDFDGNGIADIATLDKLGRAGSTVSLFRNH